MKPVIRMQVHPRHNLIRIACCLVAASPLFFRGAILAGIFLVLIILPQGSARAGRSGYYRQQPPRHHGSRHPQQHDRLPDSLNTSEETVPPSDVNTETIKDTTVVQVDTASTGYLAPPSTVSGSTETEKTDSVIFRTLPDTAIRRFKQDPAFAYANDPDYWKREMENKTSEHENKFLLFLQRVLSSRGFKIFIYILLGSILLFTLYKIIAENNLRLFYRSANRGQQSGGKDEIPAAEDLDERLQQAIQDGDYRSGIRYLFLRSLRQLDDRQLIRYHVQATNQEYVSQLSVHPQGQRFRFLTSVYEQVWYGGFELNRQQFDTLFQYYQEFYTAIGHAPTS